MGWLLIVMGVIFILGAVVNPRKVWRVTAGWAYRDPEANEPSDLSYGLTRLVLGLVGLYLAGAGINSNIELTGSVFGVADPRVAAEEVTAGVQVSSPVSLSRFDDDTGELAVTNIVKGELRDNPAGLEIEKIGQVGEAHRFTLAGDRDQRFCLTVTETGSTDKVLPLPDGSRWTSVPYAREITIATELTDGACAG